MSGPHRSAISETHHQLVDERPPPTIRTVPTYVPILHATTMD